MKLISDSSFGTDEEFKSKKIEPEIDIMVVEELARTRSIKKLK